MFQRKTTAQEPLSDANDKSLSISMLSSFKANEIGLLSSLFYSRWKGIVVVGGDGSFYEVLNGIFARPDWRDVFQKVPLGIIPSGSGNGLSRYEVHFLRGYMPSSILAIFFSGP